MNIIFTGIAGTRKAELAGKVARYAAQKEFDTKEPPCLEKDHVRKYIQVHEVEDEENLEVFFPTFLSSYNEDWKKESWSQAIKNVFEKRNPVPTHTFLLIHNYFLRNGRVFSCVDWSALREFKPDIFVTLIDDVFDSWQRIEDYETQKMETRSHFGLDELLLWRSIEITATAHLAQNLLSSPINHYVMSVKHSAETFYHLLFNPEKRLVIYGCCPITKTRNQESARKEIDNYQLELASHFIGINPLTIDELRTKKDDDWYRLVDNFSWFEERRWPLDQKPPLGPPAVDPTFLTENPFQGLSPEQLLKLKNKIEGEIVNRDFVLISQSDVLVAYRPFFPEAKEEGKTIKSKDISTGMEEEIIFQSELKRPIYAFHPKCDHDPYQEKFFRDQGRYAQILYFPPRHKWKNLNPEDQSGFTELLDNLRRIAKK